MQPKRSACESRVVRVLHVIETLEFGGAEKVVVDLVEATRGSVAPSVCCVKRSGELAARLDASIPVIVLNKGEGNDWLLPWRLARHVREGGYAVMHSHMWGVFLESALAARLAGVPLVHTVHGRYMSYPGGWRARCKLAMRHLLERRAARWHHRVVAVSQAIQTFLIDELGFDARRVETIHNGIADAGAEPPRRQGATFVTVGRLVAVKNQALMIRALARVVDDHPDARLCLVGDGPERAALETLALELGVQTRVEFAGFRDDIGRWLAAADVFLMSSHYEGISIAVLEAMRAGLPVIGTSVGGMPETVQHGLSGWLVNDDDELGFAAAMRAALDDPGRRIALGLAGQRRQREVFSLESTARSYMGLYAAGSA